MEDTNLPGTPYGEIEELKARVITLENQLKHYREAEREREKGAKNAPYHHVMLARQNVIANLLLSFPKEENHEAIINNVLKEILEVFDASLTYIYMFSDDRKHVTLRFGAARGGMSVDVGSCMEANLDTIPWWSNIILSGKEIIIDDIEAIADIAPHEYLSMSKLGVKSAMSFPLFENGKPWAFLGVDDDKKRIWADDDIQWLSSIANIINLAAQVMRNKDEAKKYNEELTSQKWFLENIFDNIPIAISIYDKNTKLKSYNNKFAEMFGITNAKEVIGKGFFRSQCSTERMDTVENNDTTEHHIDFNFDKAEFVSSRQGTIKLSMKVIKLYDANGVHYGFVNMSLEDTDRFLAMSKIHEFENFFSIISGFAKIGYSKVNILDNEGYAIKQWYKNLGETENTPLRSIVDTYKNIHPDDRKKLNQYLEMGRSGKIKTFSLEVRVRRQTSRTSWNWLRYYGVITNYSPDNNIIEIIGVNYDITELKEKSIALRKARDKAEATDKLKSAFLANMSHEIRTPLNAIVGFSNLLCDSDKEGDKKEFNSIIQSNSKVLLQLISDILDLSRMESGSLEFVYKRMDVNDLCNNLIRSLQNQSPADVSLVFGDHLHDCHIVSDQTRLQQLLTNFLTNAIKHTRQGIITLGYHIKGANLEFYVSDTGTGIPKEMQHSIFDRFVKLDKFTQGTGLGLSICKSIAKQLKGRISVESKEDIGSTFRFTMPYGNNN
jgi:PAS domain S-box-containing protein